jgi:hypothetical protein
MAKTKILDRKTRLKHTAIELSGLSRSDMSYFLSVLIPHLPEETRCEFIHTVGSYLYKADKWRLIDKWMDKCFEKNYKFTPRKVAQMCCWYWKINYKMEPLMITKARKIKDRVRKRREYALLSQGDF